jgi:hypothetical protein
VRRCCVAAAVADVRALACVGALVVVFGLIRCKCLGARGIAACVGAVARVAEEVTRELGALLEVFGRGVAGLPLAEAGSAIVNVSSLGVLVEGFGGREAGEAEQSWSVLPGGYLATIELDIRCNYPNVPFANTLLAVG